MYVWFNRNKVVIHMKSNNLNGKSFIFGIARTELTDEESFCLQNIQPFGIILFKKNCSTQEQIQQLTKSIKSISPNTKIFIDQEGGRVQRITTKNVGIKDYPPQKHWGDLYHAASDDQSKTNVLKEVYSNYYQLGTELKGLGIDVTLGPVCDLYYEKQDKEVMGSRAFSDDTDTVILLSKQVLKALEDSGIQGVIKHIPGHGRATVDSHKELPKVDTTLTDLEKTDFKVFTSLASEVDMAMTAHIVFPALDANNPVTHSPQAIKYIRKQIGFTNLIITDDLRMDALSGSIKERVEKASDAGCNIFMYCAPISNTLINLI